MTNKYKPVQNYEKNLIQLLKVQTSETVDQHKTGANVKNQEQSCFLQLILEALEGSRQQIIKAETPAAQEACDIYSFALFISVFTGKICSHYPKTVLQSVGFTQLDGYFLHNRLLLLLYCKYEHEVLTPPRSVQKQLL